MNNMKKVLIAEPSSIIREGLTNILSESKMLDVLPQLTDIETLRGRLASGKPDILLLNPYMLPYPRRQTLAAIMQDFPQLAIVAIVYQYIELSEMALFHGMLDIREERGHICDMLLNISQSVEEKEEIEENNYELSNRETEVLIQIAKGLMNKEIADKLNISVHTVISHRKNISRKTNIKSAAGLAVYALVNNLMEE
ncbi:MAG: response regulator transcription factor [Tannerella sp.]|nr:response regulator transcription factor [Tannerella sp.]